MTKQQSIQRYYNKRELLTRKNSRYRKTIAELLKFWWSQDLDRKGDVTTKQLIRLPSVRTARVYAKSDGIIAGIEEVVMICGRKLRVNAVVTDGDRVKNGQTILTLHGKTKDLLTHERIVLNVLQRMSGIATQTNALVRSIPKSCMLCATRKTMWGDLDKKAVAVGGGGTHRLGLYDFVLIKDNHLSLLDTPLETRRPKGFWEIEVETPEQAASMARLKPNAMMFDNMSPALIRELIRKLPKNIIYEASGNISARTIQKYARSGVDIVSMGALTHSVQVLDVSMEIENSPS